MRSFQFEPPKKNPDKSEFVRSFQFEPPKENLVKIEIYA